MNELEECFYKLALAVQELQSNLSERELIALQAGLRASHAEEALTMGDVDRAMAHFSALVEYANQLSKNR